MASGVRKALMQRMAAARAGGVGNNIRDGKYRFAIKKMSLDSGFKGNRFTVVFTVMNSSKIRVISPANPPGKMEETLLDIEPSPVGCDVDWIQMLDKEDSPGPGNVRRLFMDLFGKKEISDDEYIETMAEMADIDEDGEPLKVPLNLAKGMVIECETLRIITKVNKKEIVVTKWSYVEQTEEERREVAKWIDAVATHKLLVAGTAA